MSTDRFRRSVDAARLLNMARSLRQERAFQKGAAEHALHQRQLKLLYLIDVGYDEEALARGRVELQFRQHDLDEATQRSRRADRDFGLVRGILESAGLPIQFPLETSPSRLPSSEDELDDDSSGSCWGV
jgi:hypothetical protein